MPIIDFVVHSAAQSVSQLVSHVSKQPIDADFLSEFRKFAFDAANPCCCCCCGLWWLLVVAGVLFEYLHALLICAKLDNV